jgi:hypothetical protein
MDSRIPQPSKLRKPTAAMFDFKTVKDNSTESEPDDKKKPLTGEFKADCD